MSIKIEFEWLSCLKNHRANASNGSAVRETLVNFFQHCENAPQEILLRVQSAPKTYGVLGKGRRQVVVSATDPTCIIILIKGSQGLMCQVNEEIIELVRNGPYQRVRTARAAISESLSEAMGSGLTLSQPANLPPSNVIQIEPRQREVASAALRQQLRHTARDTLRERGTSPEDIELLKETIASIVYDYWRDIDRDSMTVVVPVRAITEAILAHMKLEVNTSGNYQGVVGAFYQYNISLFALKLDSRTNESDLYTDWMFDMNVVFDFVGGEDQVSVLAHRRKETIQARRNRNNTAPVTLVQLEGTADDLEFLRIAERLIEQHTQSSDQLAIEAANLLSLREQLAKLDEKREALHTAIQAAAQRYSQAQAEKSKNSIPPNVLEKVKAVYARAAAILDRLKK